MSTLHSRFTIRSLLILVAVVGLNLAGAIISCGNLQKLSPARVDDGLHVRPLQETDADGNTVFDLGKLDTGERLVRRVQRLPPQLATLEIWSPCRRVCVYHGTGSRSANCSFEVASWERADDCRWTRLRAAAQSLARDTLGDNCRGACRSEHCRSRLSTDHGSH